MHGVAFSTVPQRSTAVALPLRIAFCRSTRSRCRKQNHTAVTDRRTTPPVSEQTHWPQIALTMHQQLAARTSPYSLTAMPTNPQHTTSRRRSAEPLGFRSTLLPGAVPLRAIPLRAVPLRAVPLRRSLCTSAPYCIFGGHSRDDVHCRGAAVHSVARKSAERYYRRA